MSTGQNGMEHPRKKLHGLRLSYFDKMALVCILLVSIPFCLVTFITGWRIKNYLEQTVQDRVDQTVAYLNTSLDQYFSDIRGITIMPLYDKSIQEVMLNHSDPDNDMYLSFDEQRNVSDILSMPPYNRDTVRRVDLYLEDGFKLNSGSSVQRWDEDEDDWMGICDTDPHRTFILPWKGMLVMVRVLQEPLTERKLGYIKVELNENAIEKIAKDVNVPEGSQLFIYNEYDQCIYPFDYSGKTEEAVSDVKEKEYVSGFMISSSTNLRVTVRISMISVESDIRDLLSFAIRVMILALMISWLFAIIASVKMTRPIIDLKSNMALVGKGQFSTRVEVHSNDEIGQLESMFNSMTERIEMLINEVYKESLASKEAQISALQSQINPHFLYNALETINMMALNNENYDVSEAISDLGQMMHYCVSNEQHFALLSDEIRFVNAYYKIQELRFENLRSFSVDIDKNCMNLLVPKLLLQPFVENIVQHGIDGRDLDVAISAHMEGENLNIAVQNSGRPMNEEEIRKVQDKLSVVEHMSADAPWNETGKGYGLSNVHRRLRLIYGNQYGVFLDKGFTNGTRFIIRLKSSVDYPLNKNDM